MTPEHVWVVDDDSSIRWVLERTFKKAGMKVKVFEAASEILAALQKIQPEVILTDIRMPGMDGLSLLERVQTDYPDLPVIVITAHSDMDSTISSFEQGAFEYLPKPFDIDDVLELVRKACQTYRNKHATDSETPVTLLEHSKIIGKSPAMQEIFRIIGRLASSSINVLITGESGTGKELVAHALHDHSPRAKEVFIAINTAAIPKELLESELFGHEKGAFTGAHAQRKGRFEQANGGTLFLDEIGDMPADMQTRLLRVLAEGEFFRVGGHTAVKVDVRIIAATHQNLEERVKEGLFREDLYHRLKVIHIDIPPLRERSNDIPLLLEHLMTRVSKELDVEQKALNPQVIDYLQTLNWSGNIRQLENTCRWFAVMATGQEILMEDLPPELLDGEDTESVSKESWNQKLEQHAKQLILQGNKSILNDLGPVFEATLLKMALQHTQGKKIEAAEIMGWGRNTLTRKLKELDISQ
jgi:two-component system nitrogen regulation response regulator GlnG